MPFAKHQQTLSDLLFIEHVLRSRVGLLTPRHQSLLSSSKTLATLRQRVETASRDKRQAEQRDALREMVTALEHRLIKLESREGKVTMPFLSKPRTYAWVQQTQVSSVA